MRTPRWAAFALSALLVTSGMPTTAFAESGVPTSDEPASTQTTTLEQRAREIAETLLQGNSEERLVASWDLLAGCIVTDDASQTFSSTDEAALRALNGEESTAEGITHAFAILAAELGFDSQETSGTDGQPCVVISMDDRQTVLDVVAGEPGTYPWHTDVQDQINSTSSETDASSAVTTPEENQTPTDETTTTDQTTTDETTVGQPTAGEISQEASEEQPAQVKSQSPKDVQKSTTPVLQTKETSELEEEAREKRRAAEEEQIEAGEARAQAQARDAEATLSSMNTSQTSIATSPSASTTDKDEASGLEPQASKKTSFDLSKAQIATISAQPYTGKEIKPTPKVTVGTTTLKEGTDYSVSYSNNTKPGTATLTVHAKGNNTGSKSASYQIVSPTVRYMVHVQSIGDQPWRTNGTVNGTSGQSKRLESIKLKLDSGFPLSGGIRYRTHVQTYGWESGWRSDGQMSGTTGQSKRLEAIQIELTGNIAKSYDVLYRVHAQRVGWLSWAKNGESAGSAGMSWRLEAIQVLLVPKGAEAPKTVDGVTSANSEHFLSRPDVTYHTHVQSYGWESQWRTNGQSSGTSGQSKRLEGIEIKLDGGSMSGGIQYQTHVQTYGWEKEWHADGDMSGTQGQSKRLEAIRIKLTGDVSRHLDVWYRVHAQTVGWLGWAKNGEEAGTAGLSKRLEAIQIVLRPKNGSAPGDTGNHYLTSFRDIHIERYLAQAVQIADDDTHGYSQESRWGPDYDCSSLVVTSLKSAGLNVGEASFTGNMLDLLNHGWVSYGYVSEALLQRGDILLTPYNHTEFYMGNGKNVRAWPGPSATGDQTGEEISIVDFHTNGANGWTYVLRLV